METGELAGQLHLQAPSPPLGVEVDREVLLRLLLSEEPVAAGTWALAALVKEGGREAEPTAVAGLVVGPVGPVVLGPQVLVGSDTVVVVVATAAVAVLQMGEPEPLAQSSSSIDNDYTNAQIIDEMVRDGSQWQLQGR
jgi:hypothetical protein